VRRFTEVDYRNHLALVAEIFTAGCETVIAEGRYVRLDPASAEFAISVAESWQGTGLGRLLLDKLACRASSEGIRRLVGETLASNAKMLGLARKAGFRTTPSAEVSGLIDLERQIPLTSAAKDCSAGAVPLAA
jgi:acetyltransferase